jgi:hypothetical protein
VLCARAKYYGMLNDKSVIPAAHAVTNSRKIAKAKPELEPKTTDKLLSVDTTHHEPHHRELIKSRAMDASNEYFEQAEEKQRILEFVTKQLDSKSPKTREQAKEFLKSWPD